MRDKRLVAAAASVFISIGCSDSPPGLSRPGLDPAASATRAIEEYDANSDGAIDQEEVKRSPGLAAAFARADLDRDDRLTAEEIRQRIATYRDADTTVVSGTVEVTFGGRPLPGATVTFEPESFLGEALSVSTGTTDADGYAFLNAVGEEYPGIFLGMYRVRISRQADGKELLPSEYNTETTLGHEAAADATESFGGVQFALSR